MPAVLGQFHEEVIRLPTHSPFIEMQGIPLESDDISMHCARTSVLGVVAKNVEARSWRAEFPVCEALTQYQILHVGIQKARAPFRLVRSNPTTTCLLACLAGQGKVLLDGCWRVCREGMACLLPPRTSSAIMAVSKAKWEFCWVCYQLPPEQRPIADATSPVMARFDPGPLNSAIQGLIYECSGPVQPTLIQSWTDLLHSYVQRFPLAQRPDQPDELNLLWERVTRQPGETWTLTRLAREAGYSSEYLRRMCRWQVGRSPMQHVAYLRLRRAAELLAATDHTVGAIAQEVGYQNAFVFSNAFAKWIGWRPSEFRRKQPNAGSDAFASGCHSPVGFALQPNKTNPRSHAFISGPPNRGRANEE